MGSPSVWVKDGVVDEKGLVGSERFDCLAMFS